MKPRNHKNDSRGRFALSLNSSSFKGWVKEIQNQKLILYYYWLKVKLHNCNRLLSNFHQVGKLHKSWKICSNIAWISIRLHKLDLHVFLIKILKIEVNFSLLWWNLSQVVAHFRPTRLLSFACFSAMQSAVCTVWTGSLHRTCLTHSVQLRKLPPVRSTTSIPIFFACEPVGFTCGLYLNLVPSSEDTKAAFVSLFCKKWRI